MVVRKLVDAVIAGVGLSAGADLYRKAKRELASEDAEAPATPPTKAQIREREKAEALARKKAAQAANEAAAAAARMAREIESELSALKKRVVSKKT